ncbi:DUF6906 family protein [Priestia aryabhattai]
MTHTFIRFSYKSDSGKVVGHNGFFHNFHYLKEVFNRYNVDQYNIVHPVYVDNQELTEEQVTRMFNKLQDIILHPKQEVVPMKNGKKPTNKQKQAIERAGLKPDKWLVTKSLSGELHLVAKEEPAKQRVVPA